jgi:putative membrane protein insertion efficiency factor
MVREAQTDTAKRVSPAAWLLIAAMRLYQVTLGPHLGGHCRFMPTCSAYAIEALQCRGAVAGSWLTLRRLLRCHPFGGAGYDPVPEEKRN